MARAVRFTVGHGPQHNRQVTNGTGPDGGATSTSFTMADLFGMKRSCRGTQVRTGMTFSGTTSGGRHLQRHDSEHVGAGYSKLDGYGFINAQTAVNLPLP